MAKETKNKRETRRRRLVQVMAALLAGLLVFGFIVTLFSGNPLIATAWVTQDEIDELKEQLDQAGAQKDVLEGELDSLAGDLDSVARQIEILDEQIALAEHEIALQDALLVELATLISEKEVELAHSEAAEEEQYQQMRERVRFMVEHGNVSYLSILLSADDFADFLNRYEIIEQISTHDRVLFENLRLIKEDIEAQKLELVQTRQEAEEVRSELATSQANLEDQMGEKQSAMQQLESAEQSTKDAYAQMIEREEDLMEEIRQMAAELAAQQTYVGGDFMWPLPAANNVITSPYGMRTHPITGVYKLHTGIDLRASSGTKIFATNGGSVVTATYCSAWGNYVVINHGGGYTSLYAHMTSMNVSKGDAVSQGDVIGYVGSTGYSTAAHLHFEISKDGSTFNPVEQFEGFPVRYA